MTSDSRKTKAQLLAEVRELRRQLSRRGSSMATQLAIEAVRSAALAMTGVNDLRQVAAALFQAVRALHPEVLGCNLAVVDETTARIVDYAAKTSPRTFGIEWTSPDLVELDNDIAVGSREYDAAHPNYAPYMASWEQGLVWTLDGHSDGIDRPRAFARDFGLNRIETSYFPPDVRIVVVPFEHGSVSLHTTAQDDYVVDLVRQFAEAVHIGYVRFLDLRRLSEARDQLLDDYERELARARELQIGLMPQRVPRVPGYAFAGSCTPASQVGGDMYKAYMLADGRLVGFLADASGHAMEATIPLMIFAGILESHVEAGGGITQIFDRLNRSLCRALPRRTFICLSMGMLDPAARTLTVCNSGCPYPFHYVAATGQLQEIALDAYPLGVKDSTVYGEAIVPVDTGDQIVFTSDGIVEAMNFAGEPFGFERLGRTIREACARGLTAGKLRRHIIRTVIDYQGDMPQADDMTIIVTGVRR